MGVIEKFWEFEFSRKKRCLYWFHLPWRTNNQKKGVLTYMVNHLAAAPS